MVTVGGASLLAALEQDDVAAVRQLLQGDSINLDERDELGQTFLMISCQRGNVEIVRELLTHPSTDVNAKDNDNWSALLNAAKEGHRDIVLELLNHGADIEHMDIGGWTALVWATYKGHPHVVRELLEQGANPNIKADHHMSPLLWAAGRGYTEIVYLLLEHGAKVNTTDKYGTTALVWASRKGFIEIVEALLEKHANLDKAGMNSWTALLVAANGGYTDVVRALLRHSPNINAVDKDGFTALGLAAKDGHLEIVKALLEKPVYVNLQDRYGDTFLIHAVKAGHIECVEALLKKMADIDAKGMDNKTALYWAVEKGHTEVVETLLKYNPDTEIPTKDGDNPLMKAVRSKNSLIVEALMNRRAKLSATDKNGDNALHMAVRSRSKRILEILLRNPENKRLLYRPNKEGETAYQIDMSQQRGIINAIYGRSNMNAEDLVRGYNIYSSTVADVLSDPMLHTPMTLGLYAKWGSGKSVLIDRLQEEMKTFTQANAEPTFRLPWLILVLCIIVSIMTGVVIGLVLKWYIGLAVGLGMAFLMLILLGILWYGSTRKKWPWMVSMSRYLAKKMQNLRLLLLVMYCNQPARKRKETAVVKFLFTDNARLASVVGEKSIAAMISTLSEALEAEYGILATRLYNVFKPAKAAEKGQFKSVCCIPTFLLTIIVLLCCVAAISLLIIFGVKSITDSRYKVLDSVLIALGGVVALALLVNILKIGRAVVSLVMPQRKRVQRITAQLESLKMEGYMQELKKEVEMMAGMSMCMDAFLNTDTRLVVIVDGLDSCEQERLLQVLDTVHMLFSENQTPFITILAVDPQVIIRGIEQNMARPLFSDFSINGYDYLRNLVHLPFFIQSQALPTTRPKITENESTDASGHLTVPTQRRPAQRQESTTSQVFLNGPHEPKRDRQRERSSNSVTLHNNTNLGKAHSTFDLSKSLFKTTYFSDVNPRNMRRLMHIIAVTGRLLRACNIEFNWHRLGAWINITEQWPYRLSWIIQDVEEAEGLEDGVPLKEIYDRLSPTMPSSKDYDRYLEIDRNSRKLEMFLTNYSPPLTVGDMRKFMPCTINLDPYLRKVIKELLQSEPLPTDTYGRYLPVFPGATESGASSANLRHRRVTGRDSIASPSSNRMMPPRPGSRAAMMPPYQSGMVPGWPGMVPYPPWYMPHVPYPPMMDSVLNSQGVSPRVSPATETERATPKVNIQGVEPSVRLASLSVDNVCELLPRINGLNKNKIPNYQANVQENNITGAVLMTCDLKELKPVLGMSFGDWVLFHSAVQTWRESAKFDETDTPAGVDSVDAAQLSPRINFTQAAPFPNEALIEKPQPTRLTLQPPTKQVVNKLSDLISVDAATASSSSGLASSSQEEHEMMLIQPLENSSQLSKSSLSNRSSVEKPGLRPASSKQDSMMSDLLMEQEALDSAVNMLGVRDDTESDQEDNMSVSHEENDSLIMDKLEEAAGASETGQSFASQPAGIDHVSRPSSGAVSQRTSYGSNTGYSHIKIEQADDNWPQASLLSSSISKDSLAQKAKDNMASIVSAVKHMAGPSKSSSKKKRKKERKPGKAAAPPDLISSAGSTNEAEDDSQSRQSNEWMPLITSSTSRELLNVRQGMPIADQVGPSAFIVVTPTSSRAHSVCSSNPVSLEGSSTNLASHLSYQHEARAVPHGANRNQPHQEDRDSVCLQSVVVDVAGGGSGGNPVSTETHDSKV